MSAIVTSALVFGCLFTSAVIGVLLRRALPPHHLGSDAKDTVKLAMGLVATMTALVLGLLVASAKGSYDTQRGQVIQMAAKIAFIDRILILYGPEAGGARAELHRSAAAAITRLWPQSPGSNGPEAPGLAHSKALYGALQQLSPANDAQRALKAQAIQNSADLGQARWLLFAEAGSAISRPLLIVVVSWLAFIFLSFGLFAPGNATVVTALMVAALSVAGSIFLILELDRPFSGLIQISSEPLRQALSATEE